MYERILVAVDDSATSARAVREAVKLAKRPRSIVRVVHVIDLVNINVESVSDWDRFEDAVRKSGERILKRATGVVRKSGIATDSRLLEVRQVADRIADEVAREAVQWGADVIVAGTHGRRGVSHMFLGSVAESIIRVAPKPVLLVRGS